MTTTKAAKSKASKPTPFKHSAPITEYLELVLPLGPSVRHLIRCGLAGKAGNKKVVAYTPDNVTQYKKDVRNLLKEQGVQPVAAGRRMAVAVWIYRAQRRGDLDNFLKVLFDALNGHAWADDAAIVELHAYMHDDKDNPRAVVVVEPEGE